MTPAEIAAHVARAEDRFRARIGEVKWFYRDEIAAATDALARQIEPVDCERANVIRGLAALIKAPVELRDQPPSSRNPPTSSDRYSMPPDMEGDEYLHEHMSKMRGGPRR